MRARAGVGERGEGDACIVLLRRCKEEFVVEKITKHRVHRGVPQWLVVWKGYDSSFGQRAAPSSCAALPRWMGRDTVTDVVRSSSAGYRQARDDAADPLGSDRRANRKEAVGVLWDLHCCTLFWGFESEHETPFGGWAGWAQIRANESEAAADHVAGHVGGAQYAHGPARAQALVVDRFVVCCVLLLVSSAAC